MGLVVAWSTIDALTTFAGRFTSRIHDVSLDQGVLGFALGVSLLTGVIFGAFPALTSRPAPAGALKQAGAGGQSPRRRRLQQGLVVAQVAVSVVLLAGAGLLLTGFHRLQSVPNGIPGRARAVGRSVWQLLAVPGADDFLRLTSRSWGAVPRAGGDAVAVTSAVPLAATQPFANPFQIEGRAVDDPDKRPIADYFTVSPGYFDTLAVAWSRAERSRPPTRETRRERPSSTARWPASGPGPVPSALARRLTVARPGCRWSALSRTSSSAG